MNTRHRCVYSPLSGRCNRYDTNPVLLIMPEGRILAWYCPLHYSNERVEIGWLNEGWGFAY